VALIDRTEPDAATTVLRKNEPHENAWQITVHGSWDPHDIWLTRVRQPRELAANVAANLSYIQNLSKTRG
jgi:hypothetical protein